MWYPEVGPPMGESSSWANALSVNYKYTLLEYRLQMTTDLTVIVLIDRSKSPEDMNDKSFRFV